MSDPVTPDALRALAAKANDGWAVFADRGPAALRAAADTIEALEATRPACCHEMQTFYDARAAHAKAAAERDEAIALLREMYRCYLALALADPPKPVSEYLPLIRAQAFLSRQEAEG